MLNTAKTLPAYLVGILSKPTTKKIGSALFTQSILSLTNFFVGVSVARYAVKTEYGIYVILLSIMGIMGTYQNALVNTPLTVFFHKKDEDEQRKFLSGMAFGQWLVLVPFFFLSLIIAWIVGSINHNINLLYLTLVLGSVTMAHFYREFLRTVNYSKLRINLLLEMDLLFVLVVGFGITFLTHSDSVTSTSTLTVLGVGYLLAALFGEFRAGNEKRASWGSIRDSFSETWRYSRWALVGVTSDIFKNRGYIYIITAMLGLEVIAEVSAARLFLMPVGLLIGSSGRIILAKGAEIYNVSGLRKFRIFFGSITLFLLLIWGGYSFFLMLFANPLISILGDKYANIKGYLIVWALYFLFFALRYPVSNILYICKEFKIQAKIDIICAIVTVTGALVLTLKFGGYGTIISLALGELIMVLLSLPVLIGHLSGRLTSETT